MGGKSREKKTEYGGVEGEKVGAVLAARDENMENGRRDSNIGHCFSATSPSHGSYT